MRADAADSSLAHLAMAAAKDVIQAVKIIQAATTAMAEWSLDAH